MSERKPPHLERWVKTYSQEKDTCDGESGTDSQYLIVEQEDGGAGPFWIIRTDRWAISDLSEVVDLLRSAGVPDKVDQE